MIICKHCGLPEDAHHEFEAKMPDGCLCNPGEWVGDRTPICDKFEGDDAHGSRCTNCEHDRECHAQPHPSPSQQPSDRAMRNGTLGAGSGDGPFTERK